VQAILNLITAPLGTLLRMCYSAAGNYALAIVLFTILTKIILFPVSLWTQRNGIKMVELMPALNRLKIRYYGDKDTIAEETQKLYKERGYHPLAGTVPMIIQLLLLIGVIAAVRTLLSDTDSVLALLSSERGGVTLLMPLAAGLSALLLGLSQNRLNPLQREQSRGGQWATNGLSIAVSLLLGAFVPLGVGLYWICSNLFTIVQQLVLNKVMPAERYVDYADLEESKRELAALDALKNAGSREDRQREKADYKRFFSVANKHLVFYSEKSGFYKYFQNVIEYLLDHSNITIHYVTSDPKDQVFEIAKERPKLKPYYIGENRLITLFMKMDADIVVMTVPDLENFHLKRSYVRKDVEYIYMYHGVGSMNLLLRKQALDHYDTFFCVGKHQLEELRRREALYHLQERRAILCGYGLLDRTIAAYASQKAPEHEKPQILIAPSWQKDNIMDSCIDSILHSLLSGKYAVILRPHPEYCKRYPQRIADFGERWSARLAAGEFVLQTDFSSNETVFQSDLMITDWSTICYEFSFATKRPTLFVNTPMKIMNPDYEELGIVPLDIEIRDKIGVSISPEQTDRINEQVESLLRDKDAFCQKIEETIPECLAAVGESGKRGGQYILRRLQEKQSRQGQK
jgi:YidC/Oxa1 family membrane protein insertase